MTALAGCSSTGSVTQLGGARAVTTADALVFPPPGGPAVVAVVERRYRNGVEQDIALRTQSSTPGQNSIKVKFIGPDTGGVNTDKTLSSARITDFTISREMRRELPGIAMARSPSYIQNNYGAFGYAAGKGRNGDTCVYGWQQIRSRQDSRSTFSNLGVIQMRLRLCDADLSEQSLLATMYGYTINGSFTGWQWNPYGPADGVDPDLGRPGHPIYPANAAIEHNAAPLGYEPQRALRRAPSPGRPRVTAAVQPANARSVAAPPVSTGPMVPLPPPAGASTSAGASLENGRTTTLNNAVRVPTPDCVGSGGSCP